MKTIRIFISSPADVLEERDRARQVVEGLRRRYARHFYLKHVLWEELPLQADMSFQEGIDLMLSKEQGVDIAVFILWSRLGSPLGALIRKQDGSAYRSGTERELDLMLRARDASYETTTIPRPSILVYVRQDETSFEERLRGKSTDEKSRDLQQKKLVETFILEQFSDPTTGANAGAYHPYDRPVKFSQNLRAHLTELLDELAGGETSAAVWSTDAQGPPFLGLDAFQPRHADVFFGREDEIIEIRHALREQARNGCSFVLLSGASGTGKSSLARAGVLPSIIENEVDETISGWCTVVVTPFELAPDPILSLGRLLASKEVLPQLSADEKDLIALCDVLRHHPADAVNLRLKPALKPASHTAKGAIRVLLILDQLEELFTLATIDDKTRSQFLGVIEAFARCGSVWVIAAARSDFNPQFQAEPSLAQLKAGRGTVDVLTPKLDALRRIIEEPARLAGLRFQEREGLSLSDRILRDAADRPELLPLVEYVLRELFEKRTPEGILTFDSYDTLGGVEGALARRAEAVFISLALEAQECLGPVLKAAVTFGRDEEVSASAADERALVRQWVKLARFPENTPARALVDAFVKERLFAAAGDPQTCEPSFTIAHESLIRVWNRAANWAVDNRDFLTTRARIARRQIEGSPLLREDPLLDAAQAQLAADPDGFSPVLRTYIERNVRQARVAKLRQERIRRQVLVGLSLLALISVVGFLGAMWQRSRAKTSEQQAKRATARAEASDKEARRRLRQAAEFDWSIAQDLASKGRLFDAFAHLARAAEIDPAFSLASESAVLLLNQPLPLLTLKGHTGKITSAQFSPDGSRIVTASSDKTARLWDARTGAAIHTFSHGDDVNAAQFSPDGKFVVTASDDKTACVWEAASGGLVCTLKGHQGTIEMARFSLDMRRIVTASADQTARIWDAQLGTLLVTLSDPGAKVLDAGFSGDATQIVTAGGRTARIWDARNGALIRALEGHTDSVLTAEFSHDDKRIVTASDDSTARIWDTATGKSIAVLEHHNSVWSAHFAPDDTRVVTASYAGAAIVWSAADGTVITKLVEHDDVVNNAVFSPDGLRVLTVCKDKAARIWDADTGTLIAVFQAHDGDIQNGQFSPDGEFVVTASTDQTSGVWNIGQGQLYSSFQGHQGGVRTVAFSPDGTCVATASSDRTGSVVNLDTGKLVATLQGHSAGVRTVKFSPDGRFIATASDDASARIWDIQGKLVKVLLGHKAPVRDAQFSADGKHVVTGSKDGTARIWNVEQGTPEVSMEGHKSWVNAAQFSPDGEQVVTAAGSADESPDNTARIWSAKTGKLVRTLEGHSDSVWTAQFSFDGKLIVTASQDCTARIWDASSGRCRLTLEGHSGSLNSARFSPDASRVITASDDKTARIWETATGKLVGVLQGNSRWVGDAVFSSDARSIATASGDRVARRWNALPPGLRTPNWWPDFLHLIVQRTLDPQTGQLTFLDSEKRDVLRQHLLAELPLDHSDFASIARWFLDPPAERSVRPGSTNSACAVADALITETAAQAELRRAYELDPIHPAIHIALARESEDPDRAAFLLSYGRERVPNDAPPALRERISALQGEPVTATSIRARIKQSEKRNDLGSALVYRRKLVACEGATAEDFADAAYCAAKLRNEEVTRQILNEAIVRFPKDVSLHRQAGWCFINLNHPDEALNAFTKCRELSKPDESPNASLLRGTAIAHWLANDRPSAITNFHQLIQIEPKWALPETIAALSWPIWPDAEKIPLESVRAATMATHREVSPSTE